MDTAPTPDDKPMPRWAEQPRILAELARIDLASPPEGKPPEAAADGPDGGRTIRPTFVAFCGEEPLFLATVRPFPASGHHEPMIELGALAMALGADRLAISLAGRAWSTQDPIPPVLDDVGDMRQRVLVIHVVDGSVSPAGTQTILRPIVPSADGVALGEEVVEHRAAGWVVQAMQLMVEHPLPDDAPAAELADQVERCQAAGHTFAWGPATLRRVLQATSWQPSSWLAGEVA